MKLSAGDKDWFLEEIAKQVVVAVDALKPRGWRKFFHTLREWGILGANFTVIIALLIAVVARISKESAFEATTELRLKQIESSLKVLPAQITAASVSNLPPDQLKERRSQLDAARKQIATLDRSTPNFWPTSFQVINLLYKASSPVEPTHPLMNLTDFYGSGAGTFQYPPGSVISLHKSIGNVTFTSAIIYLDSNVNLHNVTFINCTLVLPENQQSPPAPLRQIGDQLLAASDLSHLTLTTT